TAQADFRANDRDENKVNDFWTGDVAGLYAITDSAGNHIKLIEVSAALADAEPLAANALKSGRYPKAITGFGAPAAYHGYRFRALREDKQVTANGGNGVYRQDTDGSEEKLHNTSRFGLCAYPEEYGVAGTRTFIVNEGNTLFWRDLEGETLPDWPTDEELAAEWHKMD
ncbi:MAG: DUF2950 family protein, partial [Planctomycetes bacterium]|nr:DUF2950 family protein [Planctomycetota bacterium]